MKRRRQPLVRHQALAVWQRNFLVWRKLIAPSLVVHFGEPLIYLLGLGYGLGLFIGKMAGRPYLAFLASGFIASSAMNTASFEAMWSVYTRMVPQRTYEALLATPIEVDDIVVGELLWCATKSTIAGCAILIVAVFLGAVSDLSALLSIPLLFVIGFCFGALAMIVTALANGYEFFSYYITLVITPMFILCGVFYPTTTLPEGMQQIIQFLPLTHAVALVRPLVTGQELIAPLQHLLALIAFGAVATWLTLILMRRRLII